MSAVVHEVDDITGSRTMTPGEKVSFSLGSDSRIGVVIVTNGTLSGCTKRKGCSNTSDLCTLTGSSFDFTAPASEGIVELFILAGYFHTLHRHMVNLTIAAATTTTTTITTATINGSNSKSSSSTSTSTSTTTTNTTDTTRSPNITSVFVSASQPVTINMVLTVLSILKITVRLIR
eukprot:TRINITY_DN14184_c0_g1_i1.p1 TRINITY_DN14184_c0_g1~~TRINITY_DN14184_c0_g1_i1.p1  ORF type:complete len:176 (-),score=15.38 TRINITY_DN14184_c0_g1_i1:57-584(-)